MNQIKSNKEDFKLESNALYAVPLYILFTQLVIFDQLLLRKQQLHHRSTKYLLAPWSCLQIQ